MKPLTNDESVPPPARPFSILDAIILIAAIALGLSLTRSLEALNGLTAMESISFWTPPDQRSISTGRTITSFYLPVLTFTPGPKFLSRLTFWLRFGVFWACPMLSAMTLGSTSLGLIRRGRPGEAFFRRPGTVAGVAWIAGSLILAISYPQSLIGGAQSPQGPSLLWREWWACLCLALPRTAFIAVAASWITLKLSGNWQPDRGWIDRIGRAIGWSWILLGILKITSAWLAVF